MSESESMVLTREEAREKPIDSTKLLSIERFARTFDKHDWVMAGGAHHKEKPSELIDFVIDPASGIRMRSEPTGYAEENRVLSTLAGAILIEALPERIRIFQQSLNRPDEFQLEIHLARRDVYAPWLAERIIAPIEAKRRAEAELQKARERELVEREKTTVMLTREESWAKPIDSAKLVSIERFAELYADGEWVDGDCLEGQEAAYPFVDAVIDPAVGIKLVKEISPDHRVAKVLSLLDSEIVVEALPERIRVFKKMNPKWWWCEFHLARRDVHAQWLAERNALYKAEMEAKYGSREAREVAEAKRQKLDEARWDALLAGVRNSAIGKRLVGIESTSDKVALTFEDGFVMKIEPFEYNYDVLCLSVNDIKLAWPDEPE